MGYPLVPVLAYIFMGFYKSKCLNECNLNKLKFYIRYVDDILAAFDKGQDSLNFLNFLNKKHPNITFTIEKQINHSIAILDVFISGINNQNFTLQTYHKSTKTNLENFSFLLHRRLIFFNSKFYNQIDGVAIGSPLAPVLAYIFMGFYESKWPNEYNVNKSKFYLRYVNDILAAFDKEQDPLNF